MTKAWSRLGGAVVTVFWVFMLLPMASLGKRTTSQPVGRDREPSTAPGIVGSPAKPFVTASSGKSSPAWSEAAFAMPTTPAQRRRDQRPPKQNLLPREKKPNIILILTDDQDIELGSMAFMPKTVAILGEGGAHFPQAYVSTPMCCPSRSSLLTGLYAHNHHVLTNSDNCSSPQWQQEFESRSFATYLSAAGYRTAYFGKYLNEYSGNHIPTGWREWAALVRNSRFYNYTINVNGHKRKHGLDYGRDYYPDLVTNDSVAFLRQSKQLFPNRPVMMVVSYPSPHGPEDSAPQYQHLFHNVTTHRTPSWNYAPNLDKQWLLRYTGQMEPIHIKFTDMLHTKRLQTLQTVDDAVEKLYRELLILGELNNTYIFYTSDHGYHLGQFGLVKGKSMPFEFDVRVPFYVRGPKVPPSTRLKDIVLNIDLAPTFLDIAGIDIPEHMDGKSIFPILEDAFTSSRGGHRRTEIKRRKAWRDSFLIERGKVSKEHMLEGAYNSTKERNLHVKCVSGRHPSPCLPHQKWECLYDGRRWHMRRCRHHHPRRSGRKNCVCQEDNEDHLLPLEAEAAEIPLPTGGKLKRPKEHHRHHHHRHHAKAAARELSVVRSAAQSMLPSGSHPHRISVSNSQLSPEERKQQRKFLREHVKQAFRPVFMAARLKRRSDAVTEGFDLTDDRAVSAFLSATADELIEEEMKLLQQHPGNSSGGQPWEGALGDQPAAPSRGPGSRQRCGPEDHWCIAAGASIFNQEGHKPGQEQQHPKRLWRQKKERIDALIRRLRQKLEQLKGLRRTLKKHKSKHRHAKLPAAALPDAASSSSPPPQAGREGRVMGEEVEEDDGEEGEEEEERANGQCRCANGQQGTLVANSQEEELGVEHARTKEEKLRRKERKFRRKSKFENTTCNLEKMNCFTHDNNHWKTAPLWTYGPFCFCQNANNNTFWCLRTINETHNFLYCEFITGFITFYDMRTDPYQLRNAVHDLSSEEVQELHNSLERLKRCKGSRECHMRYRPEGRRDAYPGAVRARHDRHWKFTRSE
ncbi:extracellular sulfatase Sulf1 isoform X2 [Haemaphysalis longicornis]